MSAPARPVRAAIMWPSANSAGIMVSRLQKAPRRGDIRVFSRRYAARLRGLRSMDSASTHGFRRGPYYIDPYAPRLPRIRDRISEQECQGKNALCEGQRLIQVGCRSNSQGARSTYRSICRPAASRVNTRSKSWSSRRNHSLTRKVKRRFEPHRGTTHPIAR